MLILALALCSCGKSRMSLVLTDYYGFFDSCEVTTCVISIPYAISIEKEMWTGPITKVTYHLSSNDQVYIYYTQKKARMQLDDIPMYIPDINIKILSQDSSKSEVKLQCTDKIFMYAKGMSIGMIQIVYIDTLVGRNTMHNFDKFCSNLTFSEWNNPTPSYRQIDRRINLDVSHMALSGISIMEDRTYYALIDSAELGFQDCDDEYILYSSILRPAKHNFRSGDVISIYRSKEPKHLKILQVHHPNLSLIYHSSEIDTTSFCGHVPYYFACIDYPK